MYLNIGKGAVIPTDGIVAILDLDITSQSHLTRRYLQLAEKSGQVVNASEDIPKSFIVFERDRKTTVYLSQMAAATLLRRAESGMI
ncbi:MAG: DUF370 domain-containing protein [Oscillospiraceae bacterium]|nr:DUF370 domain-containing protein [Oscillospiraceae bacterium]